jgi:hypothetical protein
VAEQVQALAEMWGEVLPYIRKIKSFVSDVLAANRLSACYLLLGKVSQGMEAIFVLAKGGFHNEVMRLFDLTVRRLISPHCFFGNRTTAL